MYQITVEQIEQAHEQVKSGADFPNYIQVIKSFGVIGFETWVIDSHTNYFGTDDFEISSKSQYDNLNIKDEVDVELFKHYLKIINKEKQIIIRFVRIVQKRELKNGLFLW